MAAARLQWNLSPPQNDDDKKTRPIRAPAKLGSDDFKARAESRRRDLLAAICLGVDTWSCQVSYRVARYRLTAGVRHRRRGYREPLSALLQAGGAGTHPGADSEAPRTLPSGAATHGRAPRDMW